jgi:hypothetical protein
MTERDEGGIPGSSGGPWPVRHFVDADGRKWLVREVTAPGYSRAGGRDLVFTTDGIVRHVRNYPPSWQTLSDGELFALTFRL